MTRLRSMLIPALALSSVFTFACVEPKKPVTLKISPARTIKMFRSSATDQLDVMAYDEKTRPFIGTFDVQWKSTDPTVVSVSDKGLVKPVGSGKAEVVATAFGLEARTEATVVLVGSIEIDKKTPKRLRIHKKDHQLKVVVKDDKGNVIDKPKIGYSADNYCIDVSPDGLVRPQAAGECSVIVTSMGKSDKHLFDVR